jgi:hypothetical protein
VVELREHLDADRVRANLARIGEQIEAARTASPHGASGPVEILAAAKYVPCDALPTLASAGVTLLGENRAQDLQRKIAAHGGLFTWDFIGQLQSRKVRAIVPHVRLIHSLASESALTELARHADEARDGLQALLQVNIAREPGKAGVAPTEVGRYLERAAVRVTGLMTMPPLSADAEKSRRWFAALRELAEAHGLRRLSMGTSQDYLVAVEEGATIVRIGTNLYD